MKPRSAFLPLGPRCFAAPRSGFSAKKTKTIGQITDLQPIEVRRITPEPVPSLNLRNLWFLIPNSGRDLFLRHQSITRTRNRLDVPADGSELGSQITYVTVNRARADLRIHIPDII